MLGLGNQNLFLSLQLYKGGSGGLETLSDLPKVAQQIIQLGTEPRSSDSLSQLCSIYRKGGRWLPMKKEHGHSWCVHMLP